MARWNSPPAKSFMDVAATRWDRIAAHYDPADGGGLPAMYALVRAIESAWWSKNLYGATTMWSLKIAQTNPFDFYGSQVLTIHPVRMMHDRVRPGEMLFVFGDWETSCPESEAFAKLEHILRNRLKWIAGEPPA